MSHLFFREFVLFHLSKEIRVQAPMLAGLILSSSWVMAADEYSVKRRNSLMSATRQVIRSEFDKEHLVSFS